MIYQVPKDIIVHNLIIYLSKRELKRILNTSRELFEDIKYETIRFKLSANIYFQNHKFWTWLRMKLKHPEIQLHLHYDFASGRESDIWTQVLKEKDMTLTVDYGTSVSLPSRKLNRFPVISIEHNCRIKKFDGPLLQRKLTLIGFSRLSDVTNLSRVQELELRTCSRVRDVNSLGKLTKLVIDHCDQVADVSHLGNIPDLTIVSCPGIRDVSALQNNKVLIITDCLNISPGTARFENVVSLKTDILQNFENTKYLKKMKSLELKNYREGKIYLPATTETIHAYLYGVHQPIDLTHFSELKSVSLQYFWGDLSPLLRVEQVTLTAFYCYSLQGLGQNKMVKIGHCPPVTDISALKSVPRVIIHHCENICSWADLKHVRHLTIENISNTLDLTALDYEIPLSVDEKCVVHKLEIVNCQGLKSLLGLGNIPILIVKSCGSLVSLEGLGNNRVIILESNYNLTSIQLQNYSSRSISPSSCYSGQYILQRK
jgi:hypothetical protein